MLAVKRLLILAFPLFAMTVTAQTSTVEMKNSSEGHQVYAMAATKIRKHNLDINRNTLNADLPVVKKTERTLLEKYQGTFTDSDVQRFTADAWVAYRIEHPLGKLDSTKFMSITSDEYGGLRITSTPAGASIDVDSRQWDDQTDAQGMCQTGKRKIRLYKTGYKDEMGEADVKEGVWTVFHRDLKKEQ